MVAKLSVSPGAARMALLSRRRIQAGAAAGMDLSHITRACTLGWLQFRHPAWLWFDRRGKLKRWYDEISRRPALRATAPTL